MQHWIGRMDPEFARLSCRTQNRRALAQPHRISAQCSPGSLVYKLRANQVIDSRIALCLDAFQQVASPGFKVIHPSLNFVPVASQLADPKRRFPPIVHQRFHRNLRPLVGALPVRKQRSRNRIMAIRKDVGFNVHLIADGPFSRETPAIHLWGNSFNDDASASVRSLCCHGCITFLKIFIVTG